MQGTHGEMAYRRFTRRFERQGGMNRIDGRLDRIDRRLISILQRDARRPTAAIAREIGLSRTAVQARIARLQNDGIILGFFAKLAPDADDGVAALVTLSFGIRPCDTVLSVVLKWPEVRLAYSIAGDRDAVLVVSVGSLQALSELSDRFRLIPEIRSVETTVIFSEQAGAGVGA